MTYTDQELRALDARVAVECYGWERGHEIEWTKGVTKKYDWGWTPPQGSMKKVGGECPCYTAAAADSFALLEWCLKKNKEKTLALFMAKEKAPTLKIAIALLALELAKAKKV